MKVMQIVQHLAIGGLEKMVTDLAINSIHSDTTYIVALEGDKETALAAFPILKPYAERLICLNKQPGIKPAVSQQLAALLKKWQIDVIHSHHIGPLLYAALAQKKVKKVEHIHTIHDAWFLNSFKYKALFKLITRMSRVVLVADAQSVAQDVLQCSGVNVKHTVRNGVDTVKFRPGNKLEARKQLGMPLGSYIIGCAARLEPGKGHRHMLNTLATLPASVYMAFAGGGSLQASLKDLAISLDVQDRIIWLGACEQMPLFYQAIDSFCLFSEREGLPLSVLEAIASYTPVIATNVGGISEVVQDNVGVLLEPTDSKGLSEAILNTLGWSKDKKLASQARNLVDVRQMVQAYDNLFAQSLK